MKACLKCHHIFQSDSWECKRCGWKPKDIKGFISFHDAHSDQGFNPDYFPILYQTEKDHFWFKSRNRLITWAFKRFFPKAATFLEIGCGTGFVLKAIQASTPQLKVSGSELFSDGLIFAKKRVPHSTLYQMNATKIPFHAEFDVIGSFDVLEHITHDRKVLKEFHAALKNSGGIILTVPQHPSLWSKFDTKSHHVRRYTRKELIEKISSAGFRTVFISSFVTLLLPFMVFNRLKSSSAKDNGGSDALIGIPNIINFVFELTLTLELFLIRLGISMPFGGSLIAIAVKK